MSARIRLAVSDRVAQLRLDRPDKLNALDAAMVAELAARCAEIERRQDVAVVVLSGEGKAFCAGGDIEAWSGESPEAFLR